MDPRAYLDRIGYTGPLTPTADTLRALHRRHMLSVPFENLDIGLGREIVLDSVRFVHKVVNRRRGGFCYELNGAFAWLLAATGFRVSLLSGRVPNRRGIASKEFDHLALYVESGDASTAETKPEQEQFGKAWLADVGFGDNFLEPLRFVSYAEQQDPAGVFRLVDAGQRWRLERRGADGDWRLQYDFTLKAHRLSEFAGMCRYHQTSRDSHFTRNRICSMATPKGRMTLSGMRLIVTSNRNKEERKLASEAEVNGALRDHFGIVLDELPTATSRLPLDGAGSVNSQLTSAECSDRCGAP